jgi:hypothetical protein
MNLIDKYRIYKTDWMSEERFLNDLKQRGTKEDFLNIVQWYASKFGCTSSQLLALCYYSYVWGLVFLKREIAPFKFEKTDAGPIEVNVEKIFGKRQWTSRTDEILAARSAEAAEAEKAEIEQNKKDIEEAKENANNEENKPTPPPVPSPKSKE